MDSRQQYEKAMDLAEAGRHEEALAVITEHLQSRPNDTEALNDAGAILHCLGRSREAADYLLKAHRAASDNRQILSNLIEVYIAAGEPQNAQALFADAQRMGVLTPEVLNRTANLFLKQGDKAGAVEVLLRSLGNWPEQEILEHMLTVIKSKRPKIAFFCGADGDTFLGDIRQYLQDRFEVRDFTGRTKEELYELMSWSDISWFEWCTDLAVLGTNPPENEKPCKTIVRLHRYEAYTPLPSQVNWENVDMLITVGNSFVKQALLAGDVRLGSSTSMVTIPNGVNLERIEFVDRPRGKALACTGYLNMRKNSMLLLQCMHKLHSIDPEYKLYFAGSFQDSALEQYIRYMTEELGLGDTVIQDGWQDNIAQWLRDKNYIVSGSIAESQGMGVMEGMAAGLKPVIHNFAGAGEIYPDEFLFNTPDEFCEQVLSQQYEPQRYRKFVEENYPLSGQLTKINEVLIGLEKEIETESRSETAAAQNRIGTA